MTPVRAEELKQCLGENVYNRVVEQFGGRYLYFNKNKTRFENTYFKLPPNERNALIMRDYNSGIKVKDISVKYSLNLCYTHNLIKKLKESEGNDNV